MSQETEHIKKIGGVSYKVMMLDPEEAMLLFFDMLRVLSVVGGGATSVIAKSIGKEDGGGITDSDANTMGVTVAGLMQGFDKEVYKDLTRALSAVSLVDGTSLSKVYSAHFRGKLGDLNRWLAFAITVNFKSLFTDSLEGTNAAFVQAMTGLASKYLSTLEKNGSSTT